METNVFLNSFLQEEIMCFFIFFLLYFQSATFRLTFIEKKYFWRLNPMVKISQVYFGPKSIYKTLLRSSSSTTP